MPDSRRPVVATDALADWCARWLGAPPAAELFQSGFLSTVIGVRLTDGREVVVKVRPPSSRLAGCAVVHRALWTAGFPCPELLVGPQPLSGCAGSLRRTCPAAGCGAGLGSIAILGRLGSQRTGSVAGPRRARRGPECAP